MAYDVVHVGTGNWGQVWCKQFFPRAIESGLLDVVAIVDIDEDALAAGRDLLDLPAERCYADSERAFAEHDPDFCTTAVSPSAREEVVDTALAHDLDVLSEKPIATDLETSVRIANKVDRAGKKMGITMSHRFDQDKTTLRRHLRSGEPGPLDYLVCRFTTSSRTSARSHPALVGGGVHHLDLLADLADARCEQLYAQTWQPSWAADGEDGQSLINMTFENGVRAIYEGGRTNAACLNGWGQEYFRAECRDETVILDERRVERFPYDPEDEGNWDGVEEGAGEELPLSTDRAAWTNHWLIEQFVEWIEGGEPMPTNVEDNLQSMAMVDAAILSSRTGEPVAVQELLADTKRSVSV